MGRPFSVELEELSGTYKWATGVDVARLAGVLRSTAGLPLVAIGSGGSLTVADFAASQHRRATGRAAFAMTPLEAVAAGFNLRNLAILLATASGSNPDVLGSFVRLAEREPRKAVAVCLSSGSPLAQRAVRFPFVDFVEFDSPAKDGFLATNSLIASTVILARAYSSSFGFDAGLPDTWELLHSQTDEDPEPLDALWARETTIVLYGPETRAAAIDFESKMVEAALRNVWIADFRHFAHGRHHWLAKRAARSGILAFVTARDEPLAAKTLRLIPTTVPVVVQRVPFSGPASAIAALAVVLRVAQSAGLAAGIDPGRPGVPEFGRRIYRIPAFGASTRSRPRDIVAVERKTGMTEEQLDSAGLLQLMTAAYARFRTCLLRASFAGVVLDYDGTLCHDYARFDPLPPAITRELSRLLEGGLVLGIATGRGKSVRHRLQEALPKDAWQRVVIGYYNGGDLALLSDDSLPNAAAEPHPALAPLVPLLRNHPSLSVLARIEVRGPQISVEAVSATAFDVVCDVVHDLVATTAGAGTSLVRSSHSLDIVAPDVSKSAVVRRVCSVALNTDSPVLRIGDKGRHPGNDHQLLRSPYGLSVDEPSPDLECGWNIAPVGLRGPDACLWYLRNLQVDAAKARFEEPRS